jgi:hypothetical protein
VIISLVLGPHRDRICSHLTTRFITGLPTRRSIVYGGTASSCSAMLPMCRTGIDVDLLFHGRNRFIMCEQTSEGWVYSMMITVVLFIVSYAH